MIKIFSTYIIIIANGLELLYLNNKSSYGLIKLSFNKADLIP